MPKEDYAYSLQRLFELLRLIPKPPVQQTTQSLRQALSEVLGEPVDKRWMERALHMLKDQFPIHLNDKGKPYGWRWEKGAFFDIPGMTIAEAQTLALTEQYLKPLLPASLRTSLQGLFAQARKILVHPAHRAFGRRSWLDKVRSVPAWQPLMEPVLNGTVRDTVYQALHQDQPFRAGYQKPWQAEPIQYTIHPLGLVQRGQIVYLVCRINDYDDLRLLCLHRIRTAQLLDEPLRCPDGFDLDQVIADGIMGMGGNHEFIQLIANFSCYAAAHLLDSPLAKDQTITHLDDEQFQLTATVLHTDQLEWWLLSYGAQVEVISPPELREAMSEHAKALWHSYRSRAKT